MLLALPESPGLNPCEGDVEDQPRCGEHRDFMQALYTSVPKRPVESRWIIATLPRQSPRGGSSTDTKPPSKETKKKLLQLVSTFVTAAE